MPFLSDDLPALGWDREFEQRYAVVSGPGDVPARVVADFGAECVVHDGTSTHRAAASNRPRQNSFPPPAVGDWVAVERRDPVSLVRAVVERRTVFSRKAAASPTQEQILAANVDVAFVVAAATDVNPRRIERYLTVAWQSGASPVVLLTKSDVATSLSELRDTLEEVAAGSPVVVTSGVTGEGLEAIQSLLQPAKTGVVLGPSGAGKSTLINRLVGQEVMRTREIDVGSGEGRHMTSHRQLVSIPGGGMIIDTPGLREAQLWKGEDALANVFDDVESLAANCRFTDCAHTSEPGCAVKGAIATGLLDAGRLVSYHNLRRELRSVAARSDARLRIDERRKWKRITIANRASERYLRG